MTLQISPETVALIRQQLATGRYTSEDELLREALAALSGSDNDWKAILEGLQAVDHPETWITLDEVDAEIRAKFGIQEG